MHKSNQPPKIRSIHPPEPHDVFFFFLDEIRPLLLLLTLMVDTGVGAASLCLSVGLGDTLKFVLLLDGVRIRGSLGGLD